MRNDVRAASLERRDDRVAVAVLTAALSLALLVAGSARTAAFFTDASSSPANSLGTQASLWFDANASGTAICAGANAALACGFGTQPQKATVLATYRLTNKNAAGDTFTLGVLDGGGPAGISTLVTATFASTNATSATLAAGGTDTVNVELKTKNGTPLGAYTGTILMTDTTTGRATSVPLSVTVQ